MNHKYKLAAFIRFETDRPIEDHDQNTIENGATERLMAELEGFLEKRGIAIKILSDHGDLEDCMEPAPKRHFEDTITDTRTVMEKQCDGLRNFFNHSAPDTPW